MRVDGRSPFTHHRSGLSVGFPQAQSATTECLRCYHCRRVSSFYSLVASGLPLELLDSTLFSVCSIANLALLFSLEAAASNPDGLSQEAIIDNLDPAEAIRLSRLRNIGIAVSYLPRN